MLPIRLRFSRARRRHFLIRRHADYLMSFRHAFAFSLLLSPFAAALLHFRFRYFDDADY